LGHEFQRNEIPYKDIVLPSYYFTNFVIFDEIILKLKAITELTTSEIKQTLNYLAASKNKLGLLVNFGEDSLKYKKNNTLTQIKGSRNFTTIFICVNL